jgi:hypothetical protein
MIRTLVLATLLLAGNAQAQTAIGKCIDAKGHVNYTTHGCEPGEKLADVKVYGAVHDDPAAAAKVRRDAAEVDARNHATNRPNYAGPVYRTPTARDRQRAACNEARLAAAQARGKGFTNAYLRALDKAAVDACFGL